MSQSLLCVWCRNSALFGAHKNLALQQAFATRVAYYSTAQTS